MNRSLPLTFTSYDLLKGLALILMIIDHTGVYIYQDDLWFRAVGRLSFPIWIFLVGYARSRDLSYKLFAGALVLIIANILTGIMIVPFNILVTIIIIRLCIDRIGHYCLKDMGSMILMLFFLTFFILPSYVITEYGTLAVIIALLGYFLRHAADKHNGRFLYSYALFSLIIYNVFQQMMFHFSAAQCMLMIVGTIFIWWILLRFKADTYPALTAKTPEPLAWIIRLCGRRTLEIYVIHLLIFKAVMFAG